MHLEFEILVAHRSNQTKKPRGTNRNGLDEQYNYHVHGNLFMYKWI